MKYGRETRTVLLVTAYSEGWGCMDITGRIVNKNAV